VDEDLIALPIGIIIAGLISLIIFLIFRPKRLKSDNRIMQLPNTI
jgi:hypothetical protein